MNTGVYNFNYQWKFLLADTFPLKNAVNAHLDRNGHCFYEKKYDDTLWEEVSVPHTYNDKDLFVKRIEDAGSNQKRTFSFYRKWLEPVTNLNNRKVIIEFEGIRQTCYLYVNGKLAGFLESGIAPFGFDLTEYLSDTESNLIAIATDSTSTRNLDIIGGETPNIKEIEPGSVYAALAKDASLPGFVKGINYFWNCNDFNPCVGGLTKNIRLHIKNKLYFTLPLYSNLRTKGTYVYGTEYDFVQNSFVFNALSEVRNETGEEKTVYVKATLIDEDKKELPIAVSSPVVVPVVPVELRASEQSIIPKDAYTYENGVLNEVPEDKLMPLETEANGPVASVLVTKKLDNINFWKINKPYLYKVRLELITSENNTEHIHDSIELETGFRDVKYDGNKGLLINGENSWLTGYAQRSTNEWPAIGCAPDWLKDFDALLLRQSNANHIRFMHVAACPADVRSCDRYGIVITQPAGDKERENFNRQWRQRMEAMRDVIIYFRNNPSIVFWEAGNNSINKEHMHEMTVLKRMLDPNGGRYMGCRTINTVEVVEEAEYVGTMLNRHAARFQSELMPITETEYLREESPRRVWDDFTPPDYDYRNRWLGKGGKKAPLSDSHDLTAEEFALSAAHGYSEFFNDRIGGASGKNLYTSTAALCWTDSCQHGRQGYSENARMSGRVDAVRIKKQSFDVFKTMQSGSPEVLILGHWNYPKEGNDNYRYEEKEYDGTTWNYNGTFSYRNPKDKTIYVIGSYQIAKVDLYVNNQLKGSCDTPESSFVFAFPHIDITESGEIKALGYDYDGNLVATHALETVSEPAFLRLTLHTGENGLLADGGDIAYVDVEVTDKSGRICPTCYDKIDFKLTGDAVFLGGYNSGHFLEHPTKESVIHKPYVYAECGTNRVFIRAGKKASTLKLTAKMGDIENTVCFDSVAFNVTALCPVSPQRLGLISVNNIPQNDFSFNSIAAADAVKYTPSDKLYCKVLLNGQEPNTYGTLSIVMNESVFSPVLYLIEVLHRNRPEVVSYTYEDGTLTLDSGNNHVVAKLHHTHLSVNGQEVLMGGEPYLNADGIFMMEINAIIGYVEGITAWYDDKINVFRMTW